MLEKVELPNSVKFIGSYAFRGCTSLTDISLPNTLKEIGAGAFENCTSLLSITIPNSVIRIGESAFRNCRNLKTITILGDLKTDIRHIFPKCENVTKIVIEGEMIRGSFGEYDSFPKLQAITSSKKQIEVMALNNPSSPIYSVFFSKLTEEQKENLALEYLGSKFSMDYLRFHKRCIHCGGNIAKFRGYCKICGKPVE